MPFKTGEDNPNYKLAENNRMWKGDNVGYDGLHAYVKRHKPKPELCESCNKVPFKHLANITGIYNREFHNWRWMCVRCHNKFDAYKRIIDMSKRICFRCNSSTTSIDKRDGRPDWSNINGELVCSNCYRLHYQRSNREKIRAYNRASYHRRKHAKTQKC